MIKLIYDFMDSDQGFSQSPVKFRVNYTPGVAEAHGLQPSTDIPEQL